ncbi:MAG: ATP synthase F1 subunit gamma [Bacteroidales bacterium]|nr:ATP synthase F1 subunit gamma [Bacteroidales bacterium]
MASLKEIRARIASVSSTQKITSAMKMVSAAKLKKAESVTLNFLPYKNKLSEALSNYLGSLEGEVSIPLAEHREVKKVALMAFSSSSGLCGVYNSSICKLFKQVYDEYLESLGADNVVVFLVGKKINDYAKKFGIKVEKQYAPLAEQMSYDIATEISDMMTDLFLTHKVDRVELVFNHFKNAGVQVPSREVVLPLKTDTLPEARSFDYIVEPNKEEFINQLIPKVIRTVFYSIMLDTLTAEHGARMTAMHIASDNADHLSQELKMQYNKARQNVITNELIDIVGGAEALSD